MKTISPSILAADMLNLGKEIKKIETSGSKYVHIDVMDGVFVPNISFGMPIVSAVRRITDLTLDVHLMIVNPERYVEKFVECGADIVTIHIESTDHENILKSINIIHRLGKRIGISIKPKTDYSAILPYIDLVDMILVMTVEPGFGGQKFMNETMEKVSKIRKVIEEKNLNVDIEVDGGINAQTLAIADESGANVFVLGTAFFGSENPKALVDGLI